MRRLLWTWVAAALLGAGAMAGCAAKGLDARMANGERYASEADDDLDDAQERLEAFDPESAQEELKDARERLSHPDVELYPDREHIRERLERLEAQVPVVKAERDRRILAKKVEEQTQRLTAAHGPYAEASAVIEKKRDLEDDDAERAVETREELEEALEAGVALEPQSAEYAKKAKEARALLERTRERVALANALVSFREGPGEKSVSARERLGRAKSKGLTRAEQLDRWQEAREELRECVESGGRLLEKTPGLATVPVKVGTSVVTPKNVVATCTTELKLVEKRIKSAIDRQEREARAKEKAEAKKAAAASRKKKR